MPEPKPPIVIEMSTNLSTGVTAMVGASAVPCPKCKRQNTVFAEGQIVCKELGCGEITKLA